MVVSSCCATSLSRLASQVVVLDEQQRVRGLLAPHLQERRELLAQQAVGAMQNAGSVADELRGGGQRILAIAAPVVHEVMDGDAGRSLA